MTQRRRPQVRLTRRPPNLRRPTPGNAIGGESLCGGEHNIIRDPGICAGQPIVRGKRAPVPKTIDNDLEGCERTLGFDTAVHTATEYFDKS